MMGFQDNSDAKALLRHSTDVKVSVNGPIVWQQSKKAVGNRSKQAEPHIKRVEIVVKMLHEICLLTICFFIQGDIVSSSRAGILRRYPNHKIWLT